MIEQITVTPCTHPLSADVDARHIIGRIYCEE